MLHKTGPIFSCIKGPNVLDRFVSFLVDGDWKMAQSAYNGFFLAKFLGVIGLTGFFVFFVEISSFGVFAGWHNTSPMFINTVVILQHSTQHWT